MSIEERMKETSWEHQKRKVQDPRQSPDFHLDFDKSASEERKYDPEAARKYLEELRERIKTDQEGTREEIQKMITQLEQMLDNTTH